jgi:hypothetical protein
MMIACNGNYMMTMMMVMMMYRCFVVMRACPHYALPGICTYAGMYVCICMYAMYVCVCVCVCVYVCVSVCVCVCVCMDAMCVCMTLLNVCIFPGWISYMLTYTIYNAHMHNRPVYGCLIYIYVPACMYVCMCVCVYIWR